MWVDPNQDDWIAKWTGIRIHVMCHGYFEQVTKPDQWWSGSDVLVKQIQSQDAMHTQQGGVTLGVARNTHAPMS